MQVTIRRKRRRKRSRRQQQQLGGESSNRKEEDFYERCKKRPILNDDDLTEFKFLASCDYGSEEEGEKEEHPPTKETAQEEEEEEVEVEVEEEHQQHNKNLVFLLHQRQVGYYTTRYGQKRRSSNSRQVVETWQSNMLLSSSTQTSGNSGSKRRRQWRTYASRSIPFTQLETPPSDAVLALERCGSYVLSLGDGGGSGNNANRVEDSSSSSPLPSLALKFYGLPSRSQVWQRNNQHEICRHRTTITSPLLRTISLMTDERLNSEQASNRSNHHQWLSNEYFSAQVSVPVRLLISSDWKIGVAFLHNSSTPPITNSSGGSVEMDYDNLGTLVVFPLPQQRGLQHSTTITNNNNSTSMPKSLFVRSFKCTNVQIGGLSAFTRRNLLWKVDTIPYNNNGSKLCRENNNNSNKGIKQQQRNLLCNFILRVPGYLLFNDEDDGFRLSWVMDTRWDKNDTVCIQPTNNNNNKLFSFRRIPNHDIVRKISQKDEAGAQDNSNNTSFWEECWNDPQSGRIIMRQQEGPLLSRNDNSEEGEVSIAFHAYMDVQALLSDIISKRKAIRSKLGYNKCATSNNSKTATTNSHDLAHHRSFPDYFYNLISVTAGGRHVEIIIAFRAFHKIGCFGVFVKIDLFTQTYEELEWVQNANIGDATSLRKWSNKLALNRRMRQRMVGPYCCVQQQQENTGNSSNCRDNNNHNNSNNNMDWSLLCKETENSFDLDELDNSNPSLWKPYVTAMKKHAAHSGSTSGGDNSGGGGNSSSFTQQSPPESLPPPPEVPKTISLASLFPDCDLVSNQAVTSGKPVLSMACKASPIRLVYG